MRNSLTVDDIANNIRMARSSHQGVILIVEGHTDVRVYERLINNTQCMFIPAHGKKTAIDVLAKLEMDNFKGVLTIVDADFWRLDGTKPESMNLLLTDTHDLETTMLSSKAFDKVISEFGSKPKIRKLVDSIPDMLLECALPIGLFRWLSSSTKENWSLKFKDMNFDCFVDVKKMKVEINNLIAEVKTNSDDFSLSDRDIKFKLDSLIEKRENYDPWQVCSGHDMIQILAIGLANVFGNHRSENIDMGKVDGILRVSYELLHFNKTHLHDAIKDWEKENRPFQVLT